MIAVEDKTAPEAMTDDEFATAVADLVRLTSGLEGGGFTCACRRYHKLGIAPELARLLPRVAAEAARRTQKEIPPAATSRFTFLEIDNNEEKKQ